MKKSYCNATSLINNCDGSIQIHRNFFIKGINASIILVTVANKRKFIIN